MTYVGHQGSSMKMGWATYANPLLGSFAVVLRLVVSAIELEHGSAVEGSEERGGTVENALLVHNQTRLGRAPIELGETMHYTFPRTRKQ